MIGEVTRKVCEKAYAAMRSIRTDQLVFTSDMKDLRVVLNPDTYDAIDHEIWKYQEILGIHVQGAEFDPVDGKQIKDARMFGIQIMTDEIVPEGEVELRAVLAKSWDPGQ